jgi:hypothetical protein
MRPDTLLHDCYVRAVLRAMDFVLCALMELSPEALVASWAARGGLNVLVMILRRAVELSPDCMVRSGDSKGKCLGTFGEEKKDTDCRPLWPTLLPPSLALPPPVQSPPLTLCKLSPSLCFMYLMIQVDDQYAPMRKMAIRLTGRLQMERREWGKLRTSSLHKTFGPLPAPSAPIEAATSRLFMQLTPRGTIRSSGELLTSSGRHHPLSSLTFSPGSLGAGGSNSYANGVMGGAGGGGGGGTGTHSPGPGGKRPGTTSSRHGGTSRNPQGGLTRNGSSESQLTLKQ